MYCDRCNVEFTEGLRYCKWCGQVLADRPRITSELHACPNCSSPVQPGWVFCKSCGVRLAAPVSDPGRIFCPKCGTGADASATSCDRCGTSLAQDPEEPSHETHSTSIIGSCPSCAERLDTGSMYCKACGAAVYAQARPFGSSALLCSACNSYSPVGSTACRVCGNPLSMDRDSETVAFADKKSSTLPDLAEHLMNSGAEPEVDPDQVNSGANTAIFSAPSSGAADSTSALKGGDRGTALVGEKHGGGTNALPGVAGSRSEVPATTKRVPKTRITSPVEEQAPPQTGSKQAPVSLPETALIDSTVAHKPEAPRRASATRPGLSDEAFPSEHASTTAFADGQPAGQIPATVGLAAAADEPSVQPQPQPKKRSGVAIASVVVGLIVLVAAAYVAWTFVGKKGTASRPTPPVAETKPAENPAPPPAPPAPAVPAGMVKVAAGSYTIGREDGDPLEAPAHPVTLASFYIDRAEVTNAQYSKFVEATKRKAPAYWKGGVFPAGLDDYPVIGVSWQDATDYAAWAGKRLPTEAEWEAAARGTDARKYPWGNEWQAGFSNIGSRTAEKAELGKFPSGISEVGKYPQGASQSGAVDMIGNVWEWVADEIVLYPGSSATLSASPEGGDTRRVIRGGAYDGDQKHDASYRGYLDGSLPYPKVGFRCAKSAP
ncbi:MAG TPA: SUMF1/EgtB/PvdO family nonheme iron enzyme [Blastocatellia bacterium]|nr:SUMF1/EgtB/PvdO family nonheme iron enzyme [Blastocatellia bacterium]